MFINDLIGTLSEGKVLHHVKDGEEFYTTSLVAEGITIPIMCSDVLLKGCSGRVRVTGYPIGFRQVGRLTPMFYVATITPVDDTVADSAKLSVTGYICSPTKSLVTKKGRVLCTFCIRYACYNGYEVIKVSAVGKAARIASTFTQGDSISGTGSYVFARNLYVELDTIEKVLVNKKSKQR